MLSAAEMMTFNSLKKEETRPLSTAGGELVGAVTLSGGGGGVLRCVLYSMLAGLFALIVTGVAIGVVSTTRGAVAPPPLPPNPPPPPGAPPLPPPPTPRSPFADIVSSGTPFGYNDVTGLQVTWTAANADADGWPTGVGELLYYEWTASSDGATSAGLGYKFSQYSGGSYSTITTGSMEGLCRAHCVNKGNTWRNADDTAQTRSCQHFAIVDQSTVSGVNQVSCVFFRGGYPQLHATAGSGLVTGTATYVYSLPPFF